MKHLSLLLGCVLLNSAAQADDAIPVRTERLGDLLSHQAYSAPATVLPVNQPQLAAEVTGTIMRLLPRVGDSVQQGDLLAELDCRVHIQRERTADAALSRARAQRSFAGGQLKRANNLSQNSSISQELLDQRRMELQSADADLQSAQAQLLLAKIDMEHCLVLAPFDAIVSQRMASEGSLATPGTPLLQLVQIDDAEVSAEIRADEAPTLAAADEMRFSYQGISYPLALRALPPLVDERSRTRDARLSFSADAAPVGAAGRLQWHSRERLLPANYLVRRNAQLGVFLADAEHARFHPLPDAREGQPARIALDENASLITEGRQRLQDGDAVSIKQAGAAQ